MDDDDIFNSVVNAPQTQIPPQTPPQVQPKEENIFEMGLGGISFQPNPPPVQKQPVLNNDPFNILGLEIGGASTQPVSQPVNNGGFGGDLLGFGLSTQPTTQPVVNKPPQNNNFLGGGDLMGFGFNSPPSNPAPQNTGGFSFNPQPQPAANIGFNMVGNEGVKPQPVSLPSSQQGFQPITNNNPNKILAYDNAHLQIWIDCIK
jgi:hypothetical protein